MGPLLTVAEAYHNDSHITVLLLKLAGDVVEAHLSYLQVPISQAPYCQERLS